MELKRKARKDLDEWLIRKNRKPLVVYGARQVGKTHLVLKQFAMERFPGERHARIDFSIRKDAARVFREASSIQEILDFLSSQFGYAPDGRHLLILDEAQECLRSLSLLKQFSEERPDLPVILTGSMVRLALLRRTKDEEGFLYPVGKVSELRLHPLTFDEFLMNRAPAIHQRLLSIDWSSPALPSHLLEKARGCYEEYLLLGGMPEAISRFLDALEEVEATGKITRYDALGEAVSALREIWSSYLNDMDLYQVSRETLVRTRRLFSALPSLLDRPHPNFHASMVEEGRRTRDFEGSIQWLLEAGLLLRSDRVKERVAIPLLAEEPGLFGEEGGVGVEQPAPEDGVGRYGEAEEGGGLPLVEVELGEAERGEDGDEEGGVGQQHVQVALPEHGEDHRAGREAEADDIGEGVQLFAHGRVRLKEPRGEPVEEVEQGR